MALWIVQNSLVAACLALVVTLVCRWGRFSPALRHALWLVVLLKLVTPSLVDVPVPLPEWAFARAPTAATDAPSADRDEAMPDSVPTANSLANDGEVPFVASNSSSVPEMDNAFAVSIDSIETSTSTGLIGDEELLSDSSIAGAACADPFVAGTSELRATTNETLGTIAGTVSGWCAPMTPGVWIASAWCAGTALFLAIQVRRIVNLRRMIAGGRPGAPALEAEVAQVAFELDVRPPILRIVPRLNSPALSACGRVLLLWPEGPLDRLTASGRRAVILHELAHLKRRDHWIGWLELLAGCGWWWNPLFWYVRHQLHENAELACDAWVVARHPDGRRAYAEVLIDVAQQEPARQLSGMVLGVSDGSRTLLERRLVMIMRGGVRYQIPVVGLVVIAVMALVTMLPRWSIADLSQEQLELNQTVDASGLGAEASGNTLFVVNASVDDSLPEAVPETGEGPESVAASSAPVGVDLLVGDLATPESTGILVSELTLVADDEPIESARLKRVEEQLSALIDEVRRIQKARPSTPSSAQVVPAGPQPGAPRKIAKKVAAAPVFKALDGKLGSLAYYVGVAEAPSGPPTRDDVETIAMIRTTYKMPQARAESLQQALAQQLNDDIEIRVKGDSLQVTASKEDQQAIAQLIQLIQRKGRAPAAKPGRVVY